MQSTVGNGLGSSKAAFYEHLSAELSLLLGDETNFIANAANTSALLFQLLPDVNWVGFYLLDGRELVLGPFQGKPACVRIPIGSGVCGTAAAQSESLIVGDVHDFPGHIACDTASQSEIVVPLINWGELVGVLDVDSPSLNRFDEDDREGLESVAAILLAAGSAGHIPDLAEASTGE